MANSTFISPAQQKKTRGFVDFDLQTKRPLLKMPKAHDRRFDTIQIIPKIHSEYKPIQQIDFDKMIHRDDIVYRNTKCSDSIFESSKLNVIKKKQRGILHFGKSVLERDIKI